MRPPTTAPVAAAGNPADGRISIGVIIGILSKGRASAERNYGH
ncbi:hypothetical protein N8D56_09680 [Devosia sp. A8/3-2]|nr:hypothetical protein N8D56_09680 [Devosia sp. A8/3-2]